MFMHYVFCYAMGWAFDIPILDIALKVEEELEKELDFNLEA